MASIQFTVLAAMVLFLLWCGVRFLLAAMALKRVTEIMDAFPPLSWFTYAELKEKNLGGFLTFICITALHEKKVLEVEWNTPPPGNSEDFRKVIIDDYSKLYDCRFRIIRKLRRRPRSLKKLFGSPMPAYGDFVPA